MPTPQEPSLAALREEFEQWRARWLGTRSAPAELEDFEEAYRRAREAIERRYVSGEGGSLALALSLLAGWEELRRAQRPL